MTYAAAIVEVAISTVLVQENTSFDLWPRRTKYSLVTPLQHMTYAPVKFEVATSNGLGGYPLKEETLLDL